MAGPLQKRHLARLTETQILPVGPWLEHTCTATGMNRWSAIAAAALRLPADRLLKGVNVYAGPFGRIDPIAAARASFKARLSVEAFVDGTLVRLRGLGPGIDAAGTPCILRGTDWQILIDDGGAPDRVQVSVPSFLQSDGELANERVFVAVSKALPELLATGVGLRWLPLDRPGALAHAVHRTPAAPRSGVELGIGGGDVALDRRVVDVVTARLGSMPGVAIPGGHRLQPVGVRVVTSVIADLLGEGEHPDLVAPMQDAIARCHALGGGDVPARDASSIASSSGMLPWRVVTPATSNPTPRLLAAAAVLPRTRSDLVARGKMFRRVPVSSFAGPFRHERRRNVLGHGHHLVGDAFALPTGEADVASWLAGVTAVERRSNLVVSRLHLGLDEVHDGGALFTLMEAFAARSGGGRALLVDRSTPWLGQVS